ncbi:uncharacterized protein STEHIDRAFT_163105 [Stereum hirsutum FP-91666 SS1]|uniref:Uncharacterized protein n=1 Tax=Stereum hirsutum (strain FP-91666) TaxID=721885 RepID=R7RZH5_STEHR|nr:uncharacterized protein STEHIDRAFT_163105 [Stereum hirsutum FP-91666 SS1]EIM80233.1 hypothetical protein STEHIDRAFT_163105 [Stereum hirsutum FP-91666 SS1]
MAANDGIVHLELWFGIGLKGEQLLHYAEQHDLNDARMRCGSIRQWRTERYIPDYGRRACG